jgi:hypothetical protein
MPEYMSLWVVCSVSQLTGDVRVVCLRLHPCTEDPDSS